MKDAATQVHDRRRAVSHQVADERLMKTCLAGARDIYEHSRKNPLVIQELKLGDLLETNISKHSITTLISGSLYACI